MSAERVTNNFAQFLRHNDMPHIRFHDLRHSAATNMHELTGDFFTVGEILGHTLKGIGMSLGISTNMADVTARYVDVRLDRKRTVNTAIGNVKKKITMIEYNKDREEFEYQDYLCYCRSLEEIN